MIMLFHIVITAEGFHAVYRLADVSPTGCATIGPLDEVAAICDRVQNNTTFLAATYTGDLGALVSPIPEKFTAAP